MTALHMACQSLQRGECSAAIVAGVHLLGPDLFVFASQIGMLGSRRGSRSFCESDGVIYSEAVACVLLKPLSEALKDGDEVLATIRSTAIGHAGKEADVRSINPKMGMRVLGDAFKRGNVDPRSINYVDCAALGLPMGDAVEIFTLSQAFRQFTADKHFCSLRSAKSNVGHAVAASSMTQLIKVVMQLQHRQLLGIVRTEKINPNVDLRDSPFRLQIESEEWAKTSMVTGDSKKHVPRRALISSSGFMGSYGCLIIEEWPTAGP